MWAMISVHPFSQTHSYLKQKNTEEGNYQLYVNYYIIRKIYTSFNHFFYNWRFVDEVYAPRIITGGSKKPQKAPVDISTIKPIRMISTSNKSDWNRYTYKIRSNAYFVFPLIEAFATIPPLLGVVEIMVHYIMQSQMHLCFTHHYIKEVTGVSSVHES